MFSSKYGQFFFQETIYFKKYWQPVGNKNRKIKLLCLEDTTYSFIAGSRKGGNTYDKKEIEKISKLENKRLQNIHIHKIGEGN